MQRFLQTPLGAHFTSFESFGHLPTTSPGGASLGLGIAVVALVSFCRRGGQAPAADKPDRFLWFLRWSPWLAMLVYMAKVGAYGNARHAAPYYVLLFPLLLARPGQERLVRRRWWQRLVLLVMFSTTVLMSYINGRQFMPGTIAARLLAKYPHARFLSVINSYYVRQSSIAELRSFAHRHIPADEAVVGYATLCGGEEPAIWLPLGRRRVECVLATDTADKLRSQGIHYVFVEDLALRSANQTIGDWLRHYGGLLVDELSFARLPRMPPAQIYLVQLSAPAMTAPQQ